MQVDLNAELYLFRVQGEGKYACIWARNKRHACERFPEFFPECGRIESVEVIR